MGAATNEISRIREAGDHPTGRAVAPIGAAHAAKTWYSTVTFNRWYDRFLTGGIDAMEDRRPRPNRVWNRIPEEPRDQIIELALNEPELLSPRELAVTFTDTKGYFVSESSVYRLLKAHDLITSPASSSSRPPTSSTTRRQRRTRSGRPILHYLKVSGWGWFDLSTVLDDFSRYIIVWKLCTTMKAEDVTDMLTMAL
jgi:transposase InsO family protein